MNRFEVFNNCKARIQNQLRIHWMWLRKEEDYKKVFEFIEVCMNQAVKKSFSYEKQGQYFKKLPGKKIKNGKNRNKKI